jgi:restriction endonuclease Mrr
LPDIEGVILEHREDRVKDFNEDLLEQLVEKTNENLTKGKMNEREFEKLILKLLLKIGALRETSRIVPRPNDKGIDVIGEFKIGSSKIRVGVQAKHYKPVPEITADVISNAYNGMIAEDVDIAWVITTGKFSKDAEQKAGEIFENEGKRIELIEGIQLSKMIIENGLAL